MEEKYIAVSSLFYDALEDMATRGRPVNVVFWKDSGKAVIHGRIDEIYGEEDVAFLKMDSGLLIRLDKIIEVDGKVPSAFC